MTSLKKRGLIATIVSVFFTALLIAGGGHALAQEGTCGETSWTLWAGQHINVGQLIVTNDSENIYVTYKLDEATQPKAYFGTLHLGIVSEDDIGSLDGGGEKRPAPGQLPYHYDPGGLGSVTEHTFTVPFAEINVSMNPVTCPELPHLFVVAHAEVNGVDDGSGTLSGETAFGGNQGGPGNSWWYYGEYEICCEDNPEPEPCFTETAFAKGTYILATKNGKANPEGLDALGLTKNRWGWAINLTAAGDYTFNIWAGAGRNNTSKGELVGILEVNWDETEAIIRYLLTSDDDYALQEVHIYASNERPSTVAPGLYGYPVGGYDAGGGNMFETVVPLEDTDGENGVWLIGHAVVSVNQCE